MCRIAVYTELLVESESDRTALECTQEAGFVWHFTEGVYSFPNRECSIGDPTVFVRFSLLRRQAALTITYNYSQLLTIFYNFLQLCKRLTRKTLQSPVKSPQEIFRCLVVSHLF